MDPKSHWKQIYSTKDHTQVSWYADHIHSSLDQIRSLPIGKEARIIDIGGGASTLVDDLLEEGYQNLTVLDISAEALDIARQRLGYEAEQVHWIADNLLDHPFPENEFDIWHDRAVLHFLTRPEERQEYVRRAMRSLSPNGFILLNVFAEDGPTKCSGIEIVRSCIADLEALLGPGFETIRSGKSLHTTPSGADQRFLHLVSRKKG